MRIRILGSAAGGRFPQWNCGCENCKAARANARLPEKPKLFPATARTQAQIALSEDGSSWFLAGASPDLAFQIESTPELHPLKLRHSPIAGVVLASADLDHVLGLLLLRELHPLRIYATASILRILREENSMFGMLNRVEPQAVWSSVSDAPFPLLSAAGEASGLQCELFSIAANYPRYAQAERNTLVAGEANAALFFQSVTEKRVAYVPAVGGLNDGLLEKISGCALLLFDGTFWSDDELRRVQGKGDTAHQMGHIPIDESLNLLKNIKVGRKMFIHLNNTNPVLNEASPERRAVEQAGWEVAEDNWLVEL